MLTRYLLFCAVVGIVAAGWAADLFWFSCGQFVTGFNRIVDNCNEHTVSCAFGALQLVFSAIGVGAAVYGAQTLYQPWLGRRSGDGHYHLFELGHPDLHEKNLRASGLAPVVDGNMSMFDFLKTAHLGKEQEARVIYHHADGTKRQMRYHFDNETSFHMLHASFHSVFEHEEFDPSHEKREQVDINTGFGAAFNDMDAADWSNVNHGKGDIAYWTSHSLQQLENNNADSFCMGFNDPTRNGEHVGALRVQPANPNTYHGVNFNACGGDTFRRRSFISRRGQPIAALKDARASLKSHIGLVESKTNVDGPVTVGAQQDLSTNGGDSSIAIALVSSAKEDEGALLKRTVCGSFYCDSTADCGFAGCGNDYVCKQNQCRLLEIPCGHPSIC